MNTRLRCLIRFVFCLAVMLPVQHGMAGRLPLPPSQEELPTETPTLSPPSPSQIIEAVNDLRIAHGLNALTVDDVLMQVAAEQASALAASEGAVGHERPCGLTLGQDLLMRGFPLWGDLSQDGYRSENWGVAMNTEEAISMWLGDDEHLNTMLSEFRSDIGAAVVVSNQIYVVLETALRTNSGRMQGTANDVLTGIPLTQAACRGWQTQSAELVPLSQYSIPVAMSTARPDGDVIHEVKYGQTLWSIAIQYGTTIEQIRRLNNLSGDTVVPGWELLVQKGATQPVPSSLPSSTIEALQQLPFTPTPKLTSTATESAATTATGQFLRENSTVVVAFVISFSVLVAGIMGFGKRKNLP